MIANNSVSRIKHYLQYFVLLIYLTLYYVNVLLVTGGNLYVNITYNV